MSESHLAYLSLGSNIAPESHLVKALEQLRLYGTIEQISSAWESESVGATGPNYLNACLLLITSLREPELKNKVLLPIETSLGRRRSENKFAPRTIDIDIIVFDGIPCDEKYWEQAFVVVPLSEIYPDFPNPITQERIIETATRLRQKIWMEARPDVLSGFDESTSALQN